MPCVGSFTVVCWLLLWERGVILKALKLSEGGSQNPLYEVRMRLKFTLLRFKFNWVGSSLGNFFLGLCLTLLSENFNCGCGGGGIGVWGCLGLLAMKVSHRLFERSWTTRLSEFNGMRSIYLRLCEYESDLCCYKDLYCSFCYWGVAVRGLLNPYN